MAAARPKKYRTGKALSEAVNAYFNSISRTVDAMERYDTGEKDSDGKKIFVERPILNDYGEKISYTEYVIPPTVDGLCEYLGISRRTWGEYCDGRKYPQFLETTTRAMVRIRAYCERELLSRRYVKGIIVSLQNNRCFEPELGSPSKKLSAADMSAKEKMALLQEMAYEFQSGTTRCK